MKKLTFLLAFVACTFLVGLVANPSLHANSQITIVQSRSATNPAKNPDTNAIQASNINPHATTGNLKILVILLEFSDVTHDSSKNTAYFQHLLFDKTNPHSLCSYYWENSYGRLNLTGVVTSWVKSSHKMSYYGDDSGAFPNIDDANGYIYEMAREAVQLADPSVNYATFNNGSGYVGNLIIVHAGDGQESSGSTSDIWSHRWEIDPPLTTSDAGIKAKDYCTLSETSNVGVIAHEFGHILGLPDMYDYTYSGAVFVGHWDLMDAGSWNGNPPGAEPSHFLAWSKMQLHFITPSERVEVHLNDVKTVNIVPTSLQGALPSNTSRIAIVNISTGVYYTIEVRDNNQTIMDPFDGSLPDHGVLVTFCNVSAADQIYEGNPGVTDVQNAQPTNSSKDHAPFDCAPGENPEFKDPERNVIVDVLSHDGTNGAYTVRISCQPLNLYWYYINGSSNWQSYENAHFSLDVTLKNTGATSLTSVQGVLSLSVANVIIDASTKSYGTIEAGNAKNSTTPFRFSLGSPVSARLLNFTLTVSFTDGSPAPFLIQVPVRKESTKPTIAVIRPANDTSFNASMPINILASVDGTGSGMFKAWYRNYWNNGTSESWFTEITCNATYVAGINSIRNLGNHVINLRVMDKSGNVNTASIRVAIIDKIPPEIMLTVNTLDDKPARFANLGDDLYIGAVVHDNNIVNTVEISINGGDYFSIKAYAAMVNMGTNGTMDGYFYDWTPSIEGNQLIKLRATDISGNMAQTTWEMTVTSTETMINTIIIILVIILIFVSIASYATTRHRTYRRQYRYYSRPRSRYRSRY